MKLKDKIKLAGYVAAVLALIIGVSYFLSVFNQKQSRRICKEVLYEIEPSRGKDIFLEKEDIATLLNVSKNNPKGKAKAKLNMIGLENDLKQFPYVKTLHAFVLMNGNIQVVAEQRNPLVRVNNVFGQDFYIDEDGICIPVSDKYTARTVFANGKIEEKFVTDVDVYQKDENNKYAYPWLKKIFELSKTLKQDSFFSAFIEQIYINEHNEIELVPKIGAQYILLGDMSMMGDKLDRIYYFYTEGIKKSGWDKYYKISVKYKNQVICTKR